MTLNPRIIAILNKLVYEIPRTGICMVLFLRRVSKLSCSLCVFVYVVSLRVSALCLRRVFISSGLTLCVCVVILHLWVNVMFVLCL